jgi:hypothetical protein
MIGNWMRQTRQANVAHLRATDSLNWRNFGFATLTVVFTTAVGSSVFATLEKNVTTWVRVVAASVSVLAAILTGLQSSLRYGSRAEAHRRAAREYGNVFRELEDLQQAHLAPEQQQERIEEIRRKLDKIDEDAPNVSAYLWAWAVSSVQRVEETGEDPSTIDRGIWPRIYWTLHHRLPARPLRAAHGRT